MLLYTCKGSLKERIIIKKVDEKCQSLFIQKYMFVSTKINKIRTLLPILYKLFQRIEAG